MAIRILVTGAGGGLGSNVVAAAIRRGIAVRALVRNSSRLKNLQGIELIEGDARDQEVVDRAASGCAALFHLVNVNLVKDWATTTSELLAVALGACAKTGTRLVFPTNVWVFGRGMPGYRVKEDQPYAPCSKMGLVQQRKEERVRTSGVRFVMLRLPEFYGPHVQTLTGPPLLRLSQHRLATWFGRADVEVEFLYMPDAAEALLTIGLAEGVDGEVFHVPGVAETPPRSFFGLAREISGGGKLITVPAWLVRAAGMLSPRARAFSDILHLWTNPILLDGRKFATSFPALRATPYREGLGATLDWLRKNPDTRMY